VESDFNPNNELLEEINNEAAMYLVLGIVVLSSLHFPTPTSLKEVAILQSIYSDSRCPRSNEV
jgi:hypothetical protein